MIPSSSPSFVRQAFLLGAGLGTRLRPLTDHLPKPLVPLFHQPLAEWALRACGRAGARRFAINTHHLGQSWADFGEAPLPGAPPPPGGNGVAAVRRGWHGHELSLYHEPELLDTGGGLENIHLWLENDTLLIHNADIFTTMPLERLVAAHRAGGLPATLALRSSGAARRVAVNRDATRCTDIRNLLGRSPGSHVFSGLWCAEPELLAILPAGEPHSIVPVFAELAREGRLGVIVIDEGEWLDLGDRDSYLAAHRRLDLGPAVHPGAKVAQGADVSGSVIGPGASVAAGARLRDCVVWPGAAVAADAELTRCVVCGGAPVSGTHCDRDF